MKALLVYPAIAITGFGNAYKQRPVNGELDWIHHGLGLIGAYARQEGLHISLIDLRNLNGWEEFKEIVKRYNPDFVGISISYVDYEIALEAIRCVKEISSLIKIIVGGFVPTLFPHLFYDAHYVVRGEGELAFVDILRGNTSCRIIEGKKPRLDELPFVDRELFDYNRELNCFFAPNQALPVVTMLAGRGCPYKCSYCQPAENALYGNPHRLRSVDSVMKELDILRGKYSFKSITWWDDTFTLNKTWVLNFCDAYKKEGYQAKFSACSRADIICNNEGMIKRLKDAGLEWLVIGFESDSQRILDFIDKNITVEQNRKAIEICRKYGIKVFGTFMIGLPTETKDEQRKTVEFIKNAHLEYISLFYYNPIIGTKLYDYCKDNGLLLKSGFNIERTGAYTCNIRNIDYSYLDKLRQLL